MHITAHIAVLALACLCLTDGAPDSRLSRKSQRPTRGFKNVEMMTARGFGKRDRPSTRTAMYGADNLWELLESSPEKDGQENSEEKVFDSIPMDWFVSEMLNNPEFTRSVIRKFIDLNQDGVLSSEELLRNVA